MNIELKETCSVKIVRWIESILIGSSMLCITVYFLLLPAWRDSQNSFYPNGDKAMAIIFGSCLATATVFLVVANLGSFFHFLVRKIGEGTIIEYCGSIESEVEKQVFLWRWSKIFRFPYKLTEGISQKDEVSLKLHPVTANPKVRDFHCYLWVSRQTGKEALTKLIRSMGGEEWRRWTVFVHRILYDFAEYRSQDLGKLFNPLDEEQQSRFETLVHEYFDPRLEPAGLKITTCSFSV